MGRVTDKKVCQYCGKVFTPSKNDDRIKFCSRSCCQNQRKKTNYMHHYYQDNIEAFSTIRKTKEYKDYRNALRRKKYAEDSAYREKEKAKVKAYNANHPNAKRIQHQRKHNMTVDDYDMIINDQDGKCAICGSAIGDSRGRRQYIDHNHKTGIVRGLLCAECNFGIGKFKDNPEQLRKAAQYLEEDKWSKRLYGVD